MATHCVAGGGTDFTIPLKDILVYLQKTAITQLQVLFMTDGLDNNPSKTAEFSRQLKAVLRDKNIYSKFSVIGIGEHEAPLLGQMCDIGTQKGLYFYTTNTAQESKVCSKIERFFMEARMETYV